MNNRLNRHNTHCKYNNSGLYKRLPSTNLFKGVMRREMGVPENKTITQAILNCLPIKSCINNMDIEMIELHLKNRLDINKLAIIKQIFEALISTKDILPPPPENPMTADRIRWEHIQRVFIQCNRNVSETARRLRMHRRTLQRILNKHAPKE